MLSKCIIIIKPVKWAIFFKSYLRSTYHYCLYLKYETTLSSIIKRVYCFDKNYTFIIVKIILLISKIFK